MRQSNYPFPKYHRQERPQSKPTAIRKLRQVQELSETCGVTIPGLDDTLAKIANAQQIREEANRHAEDPAAFQRRIAAELADGTITLDKAAELAVKNQALQRGGIVWKAAQATEAVAVNKAFDQLAAEINGPALESEIKQRVEDTIEKVHSYRETLDGINDGDEAVAAGTQQVKAWSDYANNLLPAWEAAHSLAKILRDFHLIPPLSTAVEGAGNTTSSRYRDTVKRNRDRAGARQANLPEPLELLDPITDSWGPGFWTEAEIIKHLEAEGYVEVAA